MTTQMRIRAVGFCALGVLLLLLFSSTLRQTAGSAEQGNPRADFWRSVRQGTPAYASTPSPGHTVLIQNGGENWRVIRNGFILPFAQWILALAMVALGLFYLFTGGEKLEQPRSGILIERYTGGERVLHWYTAALFIVMGLTGLTLLLGRLFLMPVFGRQLISGLLGTAKILHNYCGPLLLAGFVLEAAVWVRFNIPQKSDWAWFRNMGGLIGRKGGPRPHVGKVNAGQKAWFWLVVVFGAIVGCTGILLDFPIWGQTRFTMQASHVVHAAFGVLFLGASLGHIYMGSIGSEGAFEGIWKGSVDAVWAKQHADLWYAEKMGANEGKSGE